MAPAADLPALFEAATDLPVMLACMAVAYVARANDDYAARVAA